MLTKKACVERFRESFKALSVLRYKTVITAHGLLHIGADDNADDNDNADADVAVCVGSQLRRLPQCHVYGKCAQVCVRTVSHEGLLRSV